MQTVYSTFKDFSLTEHIDVVRLQNLNKCIEHIEDESRIYCLTCKSSYCNKCANEDDHTNHSQVYKSHYHLNNQITETIFADLSQNLEDLKEFQVKFNTESLKQKLILKVNNHFELLKKLLNSVKESQIRNIELICENMENYSVGIKNEIDKAKKNLDEFITKYKNYVVKDKIITEDVIFLQFFDVFNQGFISKNEVIQDIEKIREENEQYEKKMEENFQTIENLLRKRITGETIFISNQPRNSLLFRRYEKKTQNKAETGNQDTLIIDRFQNTNNLIDFNSNFIDKFKNDMFELSKKKRPQKQILNSKNGNKNETLLKKDLTPTKRDISRNLSKSPLKDKRNLNVSPIKYNYDYNTKNTIKQQAYTKRPIEPKKENFINENEILSTNGNQENPNTILSEAQFHENANLSNANICQLYIKAYLGYLDKIRGKPEAQTTENSITNNTNNTNKNYRLSNKNIIQTLLLNSKLINKFKNLLNGMYDSIEIAKPIEGTNEIQIYDPESNTIEKRQVELDIDIHGYSEFPDGVRYLVFENLLYITGGRDYSEEFSNTNLYDIKTNKITALSKMGNRRSYHSLICSSNGAFICVIGGENNNTTEFFDTNKNVWRKLPNMTVPRANASIYLFNEKYLFAICGFKSEIHKGETLSTFEKLDLENPKLGWKILDYKNNDHVDMNFDYTGIMPVTNGQIFIYGGFLSRSTKRAMVVYDLVKNELSCVDEKRLDEIKKHFMNDPTFDQFFTEQK